MRTPKIIPLIPVLLHSRKQPQLNADKLSDAAWNFAHTILWPEQEFSREDLSRAMESIHSYFEQARDKKKAFTVFCERIILTHKFVSALSCRFVPNPSVWFNRNYEHGFAGTKSWYQQVQLKREDIPGYLQHISVIACYYLDYTLNPSSKVFHSCRKKLLELKAYGLLQYFYNAIIHFTNSTK